MVRIHLPPAKSRANSGTGVSRDERMVLIPSPRRAGEVEEHREITWERIAGRVVLRMCRGRRCTLTPEWLYGRHASAASRLPAVAGRTLRGALLKLGWTTGARGGSKKWRRGTARIALGPSRETTCA